MSDNGLSDLQDSIQRQDQIDKPHLTSIKTCLLQSKMITGHNGNRNKVEVYLRSSSKLSFKIEINSIVSVSELKMIAQEKLQISQEKQLLHLNGKDITNYVQIQLQPLNIIHISSKDTFLKPQKDFFTKIVIINSFTQNSVSEKFVTIGASQTVNKLLNRIQSELSENYATKDQKPQFFLLESGRLLEKERPFYEQNIAENAELICFITKRQLKTKFLNDATENNNHGIGNLLSDNFQQKDEKMQEINAIPAPFVKQPVIQEQIFQQNRMSNSCQKINSSQKQDKQSFITDSNNSINFKKKPNISSNCILSSFARPLAAKIKALKTKGQVEQMLKMQGKDNIFYRSDVFFDRKNSIKGSNKKISDEDIAWHKPTASIPKVMPAQQRRKIKVQMQKLFDIGRSQDSSNKPPATKEEEQPKSPPTQNPPPLQKRKEKMKNLRFTMGSRSDLMNGLRSSKK